MKKSRKVYCMAFVAALANLPFVFMLTPENLRNLWFSGTMLAAILIMLSLTAYAMRLEGEGR